MDQKRQKLKKITKFVINKRQEDIEEEDKADHNRNDRDDIKDEEISRKQHKKEIGLTKRQADFIDYNHKEEEDEDAYKFDDPYDDEWEDEEIVNPQDKNKEDDDSWVDDEEDENALTKQFQDMNFSDHPIISDHPERPTKQKKKTMEEEGVKPFLGTDKDLQEGEILDFDNEAYDLFHRMGTDCFDLLIPDNRPFAKNQLKKENNIKYPLTVYAAAGSQAPEGEKNAIYIMKWSNLHKTRFDDDSEIIDEEDYENDEEPNINILNINHDSAVNRIKSMNGTGIVALWSENGYVSIYNATQHLANLAEHNEDEEELEESENHHHKQKGVQVPKDPRKQNFLINKFKHDSEGYAIQWSPLIPGLLVTGSCNSKINFYTSADENGSKWVMENMDVMIHKGSVEDVQFSPSAENILASCSVDGTIKLIDFKSGKKNETLASIKASDSDVNVISWNQHAPNLLACGCDDGSIKVWDIRFLNKARTVAEIQWHKSPITSIEFQPFEDSVITVSSSDNRITVWDFSVEADIKKSKNDDVPEQLMFIHQGIVDVKEIKYHAAYQDVMISTAENGFNIFKPNYEELEDEN